MQKWLKYSLFLILLLILILLGAQFYLHTNKDIQIFDSDSINSPIVMISYENHPLLIDKHDPYIHRTLHYWHDKYLSNVIKSILTSGDSIVQVGPGVGLFALISGNITHPNGKIYILEPLNKANFLLEANLKINNLWNRSKLIRKVAYRSNGPITIETNKDNSYYYKVLLSEKDASSNSIIEKMHSTSIDEVTDGNTIKLIKLNCYGAELLALSGAQRTIQNSPNIYIMMPWKPDLMSYYGKIKPFIQNMLYLGFEFWEIKNDSKSLITKDRLLRENFENIIITKNIF